MLFITLKFTFLFLFIRTVLVFDNNGSCCGGWSACTRVVYSLDAEFIFCSLMEIFHFESGAFDITAIALPPGLLLVSAAVPPKSFHIVVSNRCTTVIPRGLPCQSYNALGDINDFDSRGRIGRICSVQSLERSG